jgi:glutathione synthase
MGLHNSLLPLKPTPVTLVGHPIKKRVFEQALEVGPLFGRLVHAVSQDHDYIRAALKNVSDPFTVRLLSIMNEVDKEGEKQHLAMGIHRSDYMIHRGEKLQQVEINTISSAFGALSHQMSSFHTHLIHQWGHLKDGKASEHLNHGLLSRAALPNPSLAQIVDLFGSAVYQYCARVHKPQRSKKTVAVLMIVQPGERNSIDQRWLQYAMESKHQIRLLRHCLSYVDTNATIESNGTLVLDGFEIAVAYYRAGYTPNDYPTESQWNARIKVEKSLAIKCPNIAYHLVGTKKMQQVLALPNQVERFLTNPDESSAVRSCFAGLFSLDEGDKGVDEVIKKALEHPHAYVMKPQREGGGNLLANEEMVEALKTMSPKRRSDYILMERIEPEAHRSILFRDSQYTITPCIAELGVYCLMLADQTDEIVNNSDGWLLRSKPESVEDGGVAAGRAFLDSPYLY